MSWSPKQKSRYDHRAFLTPDEVAELSRLEAEAQALDARRRVLSRELHALRNRATTRAINEAKRKPAPSEAA
jgi:hypothetical protein